MPRFGMSLALVLTLASVAGCTARVRVYDEPHRDYHRWDSREEASFRVYLGERHMEYRDFNKLSPREQNDYWQWRHDHDKGR